MIKSGMHCLVIGEHLGPIRAGIVVRTLRYIGLLEDYWQMVYVEDAWDCELDGETYAITAKCLVPLSDPDSLTDADLLDLNLAHEYGKRVAA